MMNTFLGPKDPNFALVSANIREMVREARRITVAQREGTPLLIVTIYMKLPISDCYTQPSRTHSQRAFHGFTPSQHAIHWPKGSS